MERGSDESDPGVPPISDVGPFADFIDSMRALDVPASDEIAGNDDLLLAIQDLPATALPATQQDLPAMAQGWRTEMTHGGRYWQWRRGSGFNRESRYGGKAEDLWASWPERKQSYERNKRTKARSTQTH